MRSLRKSDTWRGCATCESHAYAQSTPSRNHPRSDFQAEHSSRALLSPTPTLALHYAQGIPPRVATIHLSNPQELNSSPHHLVATTTRTWHPTVNAWRLSQGSPRMLNVEQPPPPPLDTHFCGCPSLFGLMSKSRGLGFSCRASKLMGRIMGATPLLTLTG